MASAAFSGPAEDYLDAQLRGVEGIEKQGREIALLADEAARRLGQGGQLYLAGEPPVVSELLGRAGGLCAAKAFQPGKRSSNDVVLVADYDFPRSSRTKGVMDETAKAGSLVVPFVLRDAWIDAKPFPDGVLSAILVEPGYSAHVPAGPILPQIERLRHSPSPAFAIAEWAFVAELIGAGRRQGKQLAVYLSIHLDEGQKRFKRTQGLLFEPDLRPEPVPRGQYAKEFLGHVRTALEAVKRDEVGKIRQAAAWLREAKAAGHRVVRHLYGHLPPAEVGLPGDPASLFTDTVTGEVGAKGAEWIRKNLGKGDVYLLVGYQQNEDAMAAAANAVGARTIFLTSLPPSPEQARNPLHLYVNPHWPVTDACLDLSGYDVKACPLSGIMGMTAFYAICAEALAGR